MKLTKHFAGNYSVDYRGYSILVMDEVTAYGDSGWQAYLHREVGEGRDFYAEDGQVTDYPMRTRRDALAVARAAVDARINRARVRLYAAALQENSY